MKNVFRIIRTDARHVTRSAVAMVVIIGLCIVPCLYAWFNIFSNWDPYGESATSRIRVAFYSMDQGTDMLGISLNVGETITDTLKSNNQIGWVFAESKREALSRVYSGDCYAALVVPEDFSKDLVSFMTLKFENPELEYYENGKKNAIAPKITGQAKNAVQNQVNAAFLTTIVTSIAEVVEALDANGVNIPETLKNISDKMKELSVKLDAASTTLDSLANLTGATRNLLYASGTLVGDMSLAVGYTQELADTMQYNMMVNGATLRDNIATLADALMTTNANLGGFSEDLNRMLNEDGALDTFTKEAIQSRKETAQQLQQNAEEMARISRERGLNGLASQMELAAQGFGNIAQRMENMQQEDPANPDSWTARREELQAVLTDVSGVKSALSGAAAEVVEALGMDLEEVLNQASLSAGNLADVLATVQGVTARLANELYSLGGTMGSLESHAYQAKISIQNAREKLENLAEFLDALAESEFLQEALDMLDEGPDVLSERIASPIRVSDEILYPADNYGSQMAPFYTVLAQWVGALFCAVLLKTRLRAEDRPKRLIMPEHFFGRYALFFFVGVTQAVIAAAGDLWYIGIYCEHPGLFLLAAVATGICFTMINYALAFCLGAAGLAASVIIMVLQVGGSGGTYPVEVLPPIFRKLYPIMPFKFAMNAMREAISGLYRDDYLYNLSCLGLIVLVFIVFALVTYVPGKWLNRLLEKAKKKTKIMI